VLDRDCGKGCPDSFFLPPRVGVDAGGMSRHVAAEFTPD
jgi:hypothetical protein